MSVNEAAAAAARVYRNGLLEETDTWGLSDYPATQEQLDYRQDLRMVPQQLGFPHNITWPTKPTE